VAVAARNIANGKPRRSARRKHLALSHARDIRKNVDIAGRIG
jgi:hypothetical protein